MNVRLWWLYVPWVRKRRLARLEAVAEKLPDLIIEITADTTKFQAAIEEVGTQSSRAMTIEPGTTMREREKRRA